MTKRTADIFKSKGKTYVTKTVTDSKGLVSFMMKCVEVSTKEEIQEFIKDCEKKK